MRLKTKLILGLSFLFIVIVTYGSMSIFYINRLSNDASMVLQDNHESLVYGNNMLKALEDIAAKKEAVQVFESNLKLQEANITELKEKETTLQLRKDFNKLKDSIANVSLYPGIRRSVQIINDLNHAAILRKNNTAIATAANAIFLQSIVFVILAIITFTFVINFPTVISTPIQALNEGIREIANKNYHKRILLKQHDEFGELANAFNTMAEKLDEYEKSTLAQLRFEKSRIETIINQMRDGIIGLDGKKNILFLNAVAEKLLGLKEQEIIGQYAADIALKNDLMRTLLSDTTHEELKIYADDKESYFTKDVVDVTNTDKVIGQVIVLNNITPFHELNEAKTNFIATVSHELKTPISSIKMSAQLLVDTRVGNLNTEQQELVKSVADDAERLLKITGELLTMSQVETGNIQLKLLPASPDEIVTEALEAVQFKAQQKQVSIKALPSQQLPFVNADVEKTSWVLINLLTNAIRYSAPGSSIEISVQAADKSIVFKVKDDGKGIEAKYLPRIFDRYFKVPGNNTGGTGLGLAISKEFIEAQGGSIAVSSTPNKGSEFSFSLPAIALTQ